MKMNKLFYTILILLPFCFSGCKQYLDEKPDKKMVLPTRIEDVQALLNNHAYSMNIGYPMKYEVASDNYYITDNSFDALAVEPQNWYLWTGKEEATANAVATQWQNVYKVIYSSNAAMENLDEIGFNDLTEPAWKDVRGQALFFRSWSFYQAAQVWAMPYNAATAKDLPGIPLRLETDVEAKIKRSGLQETYDQILKDLEEAVRILPVTESFKTRPGRAAAWALLAKTHLLMGNFSKALSASDSSQVYYKSLLEYHTLSATPNAPFSEYNEDVIFHCTTTGGVSGPMLSYNISRVDSVLYKMYADDDKRKTLFFKKNNDDSYYFRGNYTGSQSAPRFNGIGSDEVYLIKAECEARAGNTQKAMNTLNALLLKRWEKDRFVNLTAGSAEEALEIVLVERRKQLCFRSGIRWSDIRRFNQEPGRELTLKRMVKGVVYELKPHDLRYACEIPQSVIAITGMEQNLR